MKRKDGRQPYLTLGLAAGKVPTFIGNGDEGQGMLAANASPFKTQKYVRAAQVMQRMIEVGHWSAGDQIPAEAELVKLLGITWELFSYGLRNTPLSFQCAYVPPNDRMLLASDMTFSRYQAMAPGGIDQT